MMDLQNILNDEIARAQGKSIAPSPKEIIKSQKEQEKAASKTVSTNPLAGVAAAVGTGAVEGVKSAASNAATMQSINTLKQEIGEIESARTRVQKAGTYTADMAQQMDEQIALRKARITNLIEAQRNKNAASNARLQAVDERYELGRVGEFAQDLGSAAGNMAPSLAVGVINPAAGLASFGMQAAAQSYGQALDEGATHEQAVRYGVSTGLKEAAIEKLTGGLGRFYGKGLIGNAVKNDSLKNVALNILKGAAGEGAEEAIAGAIDPYLQRATYNPEAQNATAEELAYQAAIGAALGSILGGGSNALDYRANKGTKKAAQGAEMGVQQAQEQNTINNPTAENNGFKGKTEPPISPNNGTIQERETYTTPKTDIKNDSQADNIYAEAYEEMVTGKGAAAQQALTEDEKNVKRFIQSAAVNARLEVKYDDLPTSKRAYYADGVLHINKNKLNEGMKITAAHEIYHALEGTKEHDAVVELAIRAQGGDAQELIAQKIAEYANAGITLDEAGARAEIGAAFIEKAMSDEATINQVLLENRTLAQRILQWVKDMLSVFEKRKTMSAEDLAEYKALLKARRQYEQGLAKLREGKYEPAGVERRAIERGQTETPEFKAWFGNSKVVDEKGKPKVVYSGHGNTNLFGSKFDIKKATSGGFYFTENPDIASSYAKDKLGNMETYANGDEYRFKNAKGDYKDTIDKVRLSDEQAAKFDEWFMDDMGYTWDDYLRENAPYEPLLRGLRNNGGKYNLQNIYTLMESLGYADNGWNYSTNSQGKSTFEELLDEMGIAWDSYTKQAGGVFPVYLDIRNPIDTSKPFPQDLLNELEYAARNERRKDAEGTQWTKDYPLREWVEDIKRGADGWATQVPTKARKIMLEMGYDGIKDTGGKMGGAEHTVWVAFEPTQIKSAIGNRGTFDPTKKDIRYSLDTDSRYDEPSDKKGNVGYRFFDNTFQNTPIFDDAVKEIERSYEHERTRVSEKENIAEARRRLKENGWYKEMDTVLKKDSVDGADTDVAMAIISQLNNYETDSAEFGRIMKFAEDYAEKTVESGQFIQSLAKYTRTAAGKTQKAMRDIKHEEEKLKKENPKKWNEAQRKAAKARKTYKDAQDEALEEALATIADTLDNETAAGIINNKAKKKEGKQNSIERQSSELSKSIDDARNEAVKKTLTEIDDKISAFVKSGNNDAELLSRKVGRHAYAEEIAAKQKVSEDEKELLRKAVIEEMYRLAKESNIPELPKKDSKKTDSITVLRDMLSDMGGNDEIWQKAKDNLSKKFAAQPEKLDLLEGFFSQRKSPQYSQATVDKVTKEIMNELDLSISEAFRRGEKPDFSAAIIDKLAAKLKLDLKQPEIKKRFDALSAEVEKSYLKNIADTANRKLEAFLKDVPIENTKRLSVKEQLLKMIENGTYDNAQAQKILQKIAKDEEQAMRRRLANKVGSHVEDKKDTVDNAQFQKDIINELYRLAKESPLPDKAVNVQKKDYVSIMREILQNQDKYADVWQDAREIVAKKYRDDPAKMAALEDYFDNYIVPIYSQESMKKAIKDIMEELKVDINDIIIGSKDDKQAIREEIKQVLSKKLGLETLDVQTIDIVTNDIINSYEKILKQKAQSRMKAFLDEEVKDVKKRGSVAGQMMRMIRNGYFSEEEAERIIKKAFDVPTLTTEEVRTILSYYDQAEAFPEGSYDYRKWEAKAQQIINDKTPKSFSEKNKTLRRIAMLTNPATWWRNIGGNTIFTAAEMAKNVPAALVDMAVSKKTGKRTTDINVFADAKAYAEGFKRGGTEWWNDVKYGVDTSHNAVREEYQAGGKVFDDKHWYGRVANKADTVMSKALQLGDRPFYEAAYDQRLNELKRLGYDTQTEAVQAEAKIYALERVYQNNSKISEALTTVRNKLGLFGHFLIPFTQTPGNLLDKCIDYSGAGGIARALVQLGQAKQTGVFDQKLFVDRIGRAFTGLGTMVFGAFLSSIGALVGSDDEDYKVAGAKRLAGEKEYSLHIGNAYYTIDWAQPVSAVLIAGAEAHKAGLEADDWDQIAIASGKGVINTLFSLSCLEGLESMMKSYGEADPADKISDVMISGLSQYFPTTLRRLNNVVDPVQRQTYDPNPLIAQGKYIISGVPGASYLLEPKYTLEGEVQMKSQGRGAGRRIIENFFVPYNTAEEYHSAVNDELLRIYETTGEKKQFLHYAQKKLDYGDGGTYILDPTDYNRMQQEIGQNVTAADRDLMRSSVYKAMSDDERAQALSEIASFYDNKYKEEYAKKNGIEFGSSTYQTLKKCLDESGGWVGYFETKQAFPDSNYDVAKTRKETCDRYGISYTSYSDSVDSIAALKAANSDRYEKASDKTAANKRDIARYLASRTDLTDPQRQVLWQEIGNYKDTYKQTARRYGL